MPAKQYVQHLKRMLVSVGLTVLALVVVGLAFVAWQGAVLIRDPNGRVAWTALSAVPLGRGALAVVSMLPVLAVLAALPLLAARFLHNLYGFKTLPTAYTFLDRLVFGPIGLTTRLMIKEGRIATGEGSVLHKVGGPGALVIYNDSAVVTQHRGRLARVLGAHYPKENNFPFLDRFEKVWAIIDLRPQRWVYDVNGMTREGIPVSCEVDVAFKIDDRVPDERGIAQPKPPTDKEPYPYTAEAVFRAATCRRIRGPDQNDQDWTAQVIGTAEGTLRNILAEYRLDWLIAPAESETETPREVIRSRLEQQLDSAVAGIGVRILRVNLGEIRVKDENIPRQWIEAWQADWESRAMARRTEGEAELLRMDTARVRAQAEMVITLTQALQSVVTSEEGILPYLLATRLIEALRWMSYDPFTRVFMPPEAIRTLKRLQETLGDEQLLSSGQGGERGVEGKT